MPVFYPKGTFPAMTNTERQRRFRERHPGYYGRLHRQRKARLQAYSATKALRVKAAALVAEWAKTPLMLPAPAITFEFPGINALPARSVETREAVMVNAK